MTLEQALDCCEADPLGYQSAVTTYFHWHFTAVRHPGAEITFTESSEDDPTIRPATFYLHPEMDWQPQWPRRADC